MLPTAPLPSTKLTVEDTLHLQPVRPTTQVIDVLSELQPGQKIVALIQAQLANGAYRATIAQRDVTLALPFSAKPGDALNLEVVQTEGRIAFAISKAPTEGQAARGSATTILSGTAQLIGQLLSAGRPESERAAVLNANRPILSDPSAPSGQNAPVLQRALSQSGLFFESHQSSWTAGRLAEAALRAEPQAMLMRGTTPPIPPAPAGSGGGPQAYPGSHASSVAPPPASTAETPLAPPGGTADSVALRPTRTTAMEPSAADASLVRRGGESSPTGNVGETAKATGTRPAVPAELAPLVQQQLSSLASNVYSFQGMVWAGQGFHWEIVDEESRRGPKHTPGEPERPWTTRLRLLLPSLGGIDATIRLEGSELAIDMTTGSLGTRETLRSARDRLRDRMELAGLRLMALDIRPAPPEPAEPPEDGSDG